MGGDMGGKDCFYGILLLFTNSFSGQYGVILS